jgi:hypothetical protein
VAIASLSGPDPSLSLQLSPLQHFLIDLFIVAIQTQSCLLLAIFGVGFDAFRISLLGFFLLLRLLRRNLRFGWDDSLGARGQSDDDHGITCYLALTSGSIVGPWQCSPFDE